jgi:uncharacterized membrane protein required for colicin V production
VVIGAAGSGRVAAALAARQLLRPLVAQVVAFVAILAVIVLAANLVALIVDRLVRALLLGGFNRVAGTAFGVAKGAAVLGLGLLAAERLSPPTFSELVASSTLGRPLVRLAISLLDAGRSFAAATGGQN